MIVLKNRERAGRFEVAETENDFHKMNHEYITVRGGVEELEKSDRGMR